MIETSISVGILTVCILIIRKLLNKHISPEWIYSLWLVVVIRLLILPFCNYSQKISLYHFHLKSVIDSAYDKLNFVIITEAVPTLTISNSSLQSNVVKAYSALSVADILYILWAAGCILTFGSIFLKYFKARNLLYKRGVFYEMTESKLPVYIVDRLPSPCLVGKRIYVGKTVIENEKHLNYAILHETHHFRQGDLIWNFIRVVCVSIYWFNPFVWIAAYFSRIDGEFSCDARTVTGMTLEEKKHYSITLLELATNTKFIECKGMFSNMNSGNIIQRIKVINDKKRKTKWIIFCFVFVFLLFGIIFTLNSNQRFGYSYRERIKDIESYQEFEITNDITFKDVEYSDGILSFHVYNGSNATYFIHDRWMEYWRNDGWYLVNENKIKKSRAVYGFLPDDSFPENVDEDAEIHDLMRDKITIYVKILNENINDVYGTVEPGKYRMNYVLWEEGFEDKKVLASLEFIVLEE